MLNYQEFLNLKYKEIGKMLGKISDSNNTNNRPKDIDDYIENSYSKKRLKKRRSIRTNIN
jgi:hypothetical protein